MPAGPRASFFGLIGGMASVLIVVWTLRVGYLWYNVIGCAGVLATGFAITALGLEKAGATRSARGSP